MSDFPFGGRTNGGPSLPMETYLSVADVAKILYVSKKAVYQAIQHQGLPAHKIGKYWRIAPSELQTWLDENLR